MKLIWESDINSADMFIRIYYGDGIYRVCDDYTDVHFDVPAHMIDTLLDLGSIEYGEDEPYIYAQEWDEGESVLFGFMGEEDDNSKCFSLAEWEEFKQLILNAKAQEVQS